MIYAKTVTAVELSFLSTPPIPHNALENDFVSNVSLISPNHEKIFNKIYDFIRFHHSYAGVRNLITAVQMKIHNHVQVPVGTDKPTMTWPGNDAFITNYKEHGDVYTPSLYTKSQQVVDSSEHPELYNVALEDL